ncbi:MULTISPECIES: D-alanyl-D-alanine carboxypeptidase family protein [Rubrivivax]|uniref:serine-type D-Ala-D-Ala carboxypeptidase n=1 Tax=Rubrivivax benzoatilyticus TaxID=316997 RepID=A0ABX0I2R9_9BURK|nr:MULTISPECIES: D-alanyl-D-alanine carboxypeptidase family protein [Rubrivivax]EGJ11890.1 serine-type D-Ala-D-Ala carboxypeptidase [Rubrivivax benzoatilyticus JA2 = ATCC BAA-35]MCC9596473.1 D-alanyl-D-alanine carboxypeptidase [Rubrivivax sp. JA1055]MCC9648628.1 D-alanyl-D-alanine carboxypeptidase [Rubrivivax sp. JA1029]NHL00109.1 D-alanyl-D-alanine carboxypeptidase [Rubrivivax benzoatilyticus]NHL25875.1 D-alanyl-D-alanine carboxypeptidase [Rubrivivax benzoatilyticus]
MKRLLSLALAFFVAGAHAQAPVPPEVAARQYILIDVSANQVLAERDADTPADPASLTKLMSAYLVFNAVRDGKLALDQRVPVSTRAWDERKYGGSLMFIDTRMQPRVDELLRGMIVQSGNDATVALAEAVGGTVENFVAMMNKQAQAWGLKNTQFRNPSGLTEAGHKTTPREIAYIATRIIQDHPQFYPIYSERAFAFNNIRQDNRNLLLGRDPSVDGMKTGYTEAAGYCLVASAQRDMPNGKRRLLSVVMGTASMQARANESQKLLNWGYAAWDAIRLFDAGKAVATVPVWKGNKSEARLGAPGAIFVAVPRGEGDKLKTSIQRTDPLVAPLQQGQRVGTLKVTTAGGTPVAEIPLQVLEPVGLAGIFGRAWDAVRLWIK